MSAPRLTPLSPDLFARTPWKNGGGTTIDIAAAYRPGAMQGSWEGMIWRLGRTAIVQPGPFSDLTGFERLQAVIGGSGLVLEAPDHEIDLREPYQPVRYDGGTPIISRLENGPVEVVNLMADRDLCRIDLRVAATGRELPLAAGTHVLYAPDMALTYRLGTLLLAIDAGHALQIVNDEAIDIVIASGRALLASIIATNALH